MKLTWNMPARLVTWNGGPQAVWNGSINENNMNSKNPIALKLQELTDADFARLLHSTHAKYLEHIVDFPDLATQAALLLSTAVTMDGKLDAVSKATSALSTAVTEKNLFRPTAEGVLTNFGEDAGKAVNYDPTKLGQIFTLRKVREKLAVDVVEGLALSFHEAPGALNMIWHPQKGAKSYEIWVNLTPNNEAGWTLREIATESHYKLTGLPSGQVVQVRVRAVGPHSSKGDFSPAVAHLVS